MPIYIFLRENSSKVRMVVDLLSSPDVTSDTPKCCTDEETHVLTKFEEGSFEPEFCNYWRENKTSHDLPALMS